MVTTTETTNRSSTVKNRIQCRQEFIIQWLQEFYNQPGVLEKIMPILLGESKISLRLVDWFVTNYAKKNNTSYLLSDRQFVVHFNYKRELKAYSKRLFDPFCRRERILFQVRGAEKLLTTVGQLNFFRWAIEKNILSFIEEKLDDIEKDMNQSIREHYKESDSDEPTKGISASGRRKRSELSKSAMKTVNTHNVNTLVSFC